MDAAVYVDSFIFPRIEADNKTMKRFIITFKIYLLARILLQRFNCNDFLWPVAVDATNITEAVIKSQEYLQDRMLELNIDMDDIKFSYAVTTEEDLRF